MAYQEKVPVCLFKHFTDIECPLCGMTRACFNILNFNLVVAFRYNPVSLLLPLMLVTEIAFDLFPSDRLRSVRRYLFILFAVSLLLLFIVRIVKHFIA